MNDTKIQIHYQRHPAQQQVNNSKARFKAIACGRRWGKTKDSWYWLFEQAIETPESLGWWVAPTYKQLAPVSLTVKQELPQIVIKKKLMTQETVRYIELVNGSMIYFHSADNPEDMRGSGIHNLVIDEAAQIKKAAWTEVLRPALADHRGHARFISTPKGRNWFFEEFTRGQDSTFPEYDSFQFPTSSNPYISVEEIELARLALSEAVFNQEFLAQFQDNVGSVFKNIEDYINSNHVCVDTTFLKGCDLAKHQDFTVLTALCSHGYLMGFERFNRIDWVFQKKKIVSFSDKYPGPMLMDSTGIGDPIFDDLVNVIDVEGYKFTNSSKKELVENFIMMLDGGRLSYPLLDVLINELKLYTYKLGPTGLVSYGAPDGYHDDCPTSLMLAAWLLGTYRVRRPLMA